VRPLNAGALLYNKLYSELIVLYKERTPNKINFQLTPKDLPVTNALNLKKDAVNEIHDSATCERD
jgi:hypothetical protein